MNIKKFILNLRVVRVIAQLFFYYPALRFAPKQVYVHAGAGL